MPPPKTIAQALDLYLAEIYKSRSANTGRTYGYIIGKFKLTLTHYQHPPESTPLSALDNEWVSWFLNDLRELSATTERGYLPVISGFYEYVVAKNWSTINLTELKYFIKRRQRSLPKRVQRFPSEQIEALLTLLDRRSREAFEHEREQLAVLRDCALFYMLADSGLRISEACSRERGHVDWSEAMLFVLGKGNKEALVRLSQRTLKRLKRYLTVRQSWDGGQAVPLAKLTLFARHDKRARQEILPMSPRAVQKNLERWVAQLPADQQLLEISPHTFRHYFVTTVLRKTSGDVEVAKRLARHADISTTMGYAHLSDDQLDQIYDEVFNR